jgi:hypothetical protein
MIEERRQSMLKTSVLPIALPKKVGTGEAREINFCVNYFYFQFLCYFPELHAIKR